jgi:hypothetical protein
MIRIKSPRDFGAALVILAIGLAGVYFASDLRMGSASRMGPGYFPQILSWCIVALGIFIGAKSLVMQGPPVERMQLRPIGVLVVSSLVFGYAIEEVGLAIAAVAAMLIAPYARRGASLREALLLSIGLTAFAIVVFVWALGQPLPLWRGR